MPASLDSARAEIREVRALQNLLADLLGFGQGFGLGQFLLSGGQGHGRALHADEDMARADLLVVGFVRLIVCLQQGLVAADLALDVLVGMSGQDAGGGEHELGLEGFGFGELAPAAFPGEEQDADHLVDEPVASRAIDEHALIFRIGLQNLIHLCGGNFDVAHLDHHAVRRNDGHGRDVQRHGDAIGPGQRGARGRGAGGRGACDGCGQYGRLRGRLGGRLGHQAQTCRVQGKNPEKTHDLHDNKGANPCPSKRESTPAGSTMARMEPLERGRRQSGP